MAVAPPASDDRRSRDRLAVDRRAVLRLEGRVEAILLEDLTAGGCRFLCDADLPLAAAISIGIAGVGHTPAHVVWRSGASYGCAFDRPLPAGAVTSEAPDNVARMAQAAPFGQTVAGASQSVPAEVMLSLRVRVAIISGLTGALWSAIIGLVRAVL